MTFPAAKTAFASFCSHTATYLLQGAHVLDRPLFSLSSTVAYREKPWTSFKSFVFTSILTLPLIGGMTLSLAAAVLRFFAAPWQKEPFTYQKGTYAEKAKSSLTLLTANICCMQGALPHLFGQIRPAAARIKQIAEKILSAEADFVCLQEMHDPNISWQLANHLKSSYAHLYFNIGSALLLNSGIFVASKLPLENFTFTSFKQGAINKGFVNFKFKYKDKTIHLINTHLGSSADDFHPTASEEKIRLQQLAKIWQNLQKNCADFHLVTGDLNIVANSKAYIALLQNYRDLSSQIKKTWKHPTNAQDIKLDYILQPHTDQPLLSSTRLFPLFDLLHPQDLSDHHGLIFTLKV